MVRRILAEQVSNDTSVREIASREEDALLGACSNSAAEFPDFLWAYGTGISLALEGNLCRDQGTDTKISLTVNTAISYATSHFDVLHSDQSGFWG